MDTSVPFGHFPRNSFRVVVAFLVPLVLAGTAVAVGGSTRAPHASLGEVSGAASAVPSPVSQRAQRLQRRLEKTYGRTVPFLDLERALRERDALLRKSVTVGWEADDGARFEPWTASVSAYPVWVQPSWEGESFTFAVREALITAFLSTSLPSGIPMPVTAVLLTTTDKDGVLHAVADRDAEPGYAVDGHDTALLVRSALLSSQTGVTVSLKATPGRVINETGLDLGPLTLLATGRSNFAGSGQGRIANVRKGLHERIDGVLIPPGETFSFNRAVNDMRQGGWQEALVIVNGKDLVSAPGGGICQVATTVYRAALHAGLPVTERANHSLFVTYYTQYGVGIDATIYPKRQDLVFINDTGKYVLLQAYAKGFEAYVHMYGAPDGRTVAMDGPYFQSTVTPEVADIFGSGVRGNEIAWVYSVRSADGTERTGAIRSRYLSIPKSLKDQYAHATDETRRTLPGSLMTMR